MGGHDRGGGIDEGARAGMEQRISYPVEAALVVLAQGFAPRCIARLDASGGDARRALTNDPALRREFLATYERRRRRYVDRIGPFLPKACDALLDVGCGMALVPLLLYRRWEGRTVLWLLDRSVDLGSAIRAPRGFHEDGYVFTASLDLTRRFLRDNGVAPEKVHTLEAGHDPLPREPTFDLIVARRSWGMFFPVETYVEEALRTLKPHGRVILDVRKGTAGEAALRDAFPHVGVVADEPSLKTLVASRMPTNLDMP